MATVDDASPPTPTLTLTAGCGERMWEPIWLPARIPKGKRTPRVTIKIIHNDYEEVSSALMEAARRIPKLSAPKNAKRAKKALEQQPMFTVHEVAPLKLVIRKVRPAETENATSHNEESHQRGKRKIHEAELAKEPINTKKVKLISESSTELQHDSHEILVV